ncbi:DUF4440 domain-containing protein [bacterium]|nr:MAG: DUF4440 domain-containing protein [bacterium]
MGNDEATLRQLIESLTEGIRTKDADRATAPYAERNVMYVLEPPLESRTEGGVSAEGAGRAGVQAWFDTWAGDLAYDRRGTEIVCDGEIAFAHGLVHLAGTKSNGAKTDLWFRETFGFRRLGGEWKIVHQHQSVPFQMDGSGRAALDLKPE